TPALSPGRGSTICPCWNESRFSQLLSEVRKPLPLPGERAGVRASFHCHRSSSSAHSPPHSTGVVRLLPLLVGVVLCTSLIPARGESPAPGPASARSLSG